MFEKELVDWIAGRTSNSKSTLIAIGDDACLLGPNDRGTVVTTDTLCDQVHFDATKHSLHRIGRKSVAISISDVLAMGAKPEQALLTFFLPKSLTMEQAQELFLGAESLASAQGVEIVGGDTNRYDGPLIVGSTLLGRVEPSKAWRIDGAQSDDAILVTGKLGGSILGKHLDFEPRSKWVQEVAAEHEIHAATDITDSLSLDLDYLLQKSNKGAEIHADQIPIAEDAITLSSQSGKSALEHALTDGEDFELVLCVSESIADELRCKFGDVVTRIGTVVSQSGLTLIDGDSRRTLQPKGYVH